MRYLNFGGGCEPAHALYKQSRSIDYVLSPFDWLGVPTGCLPFVLGSEWWKDIFSSIVTYNCAAEGKIGVRDLKYGINSIHHFNSSGLDNYFELISGQVLLFREKLHVRWQEMILSDHVGLVLLYREFQPPYGVKGDLSLAVDAIKRVMPKSRLVVIGEEPRELAGAIFIKQKKLTRLFFKTQSWFQAYDYIFKNIDQLECDKIYEPN
jgi:hypothetical protein